MGQMTASSASTSAGRRSRPPPSRAASSAKPTSSPPTSSDTDALLDQLVGAVRRAAGDDGIAAVGLGLPSVIEWETGRVRSSVNIPLADVPLREVLADRLDVPVFVDNDASVAALAEAEAAGVRNLVMLTVGTGVGGGVVIDGRVFRGATGAAPELGPHAHRRRPLDRRARRRRARSRSPARSRRSPRAPRWARLGQQHGYEDGQAVVEAADNGDDDAPRAGRDDRPTPRRGHRQRHPRLRPRGRRHRRRRLDGRRHAARPAPARPPALPAARRRARETEIRLRQDRRRRGRARRRAAGRPTNCDDNNADRRPRDEHHEPASTSGSRRSPRPARASGSTDPAPLPDRDRRAAADDRRGLAARRDLQPRDLREGDPRLRGLRRAARASSPARAPTRRDIYRAIVVQDVQGAGRRAALRLGRDRPRATATSRSRSSPTSPTTPRARSPRPRGVLGARRPAQPDDQDPGHRPRACPAIEEAHLRGHQRQRDAAVRRRGLRRGRRAPTSAACERRQAEGKSLDVHSRRLFFVSRVDTEVDKRLEKLGRDGPARPRRPRQRPRRLPALQGDLPRRALRRAARRRRAGAAAAVGVDRRQEPALPRHALRRRASSAPETVNTMPMATLLAAADHGEADRGDRRRATRADDLRALADAGIDMDDVTDKLLRDGIAAFVTPMDKLLAGIESKREAIVTGRPPTIESQRSPTTLERADRRPHRARRRASDVARRIWEQGRRRCGAPTGHAGGRRPARLADDRRADARARPTTSSAFARGASADGLTDAVLLGHGRLVAGARGASAARSATATAHCACTCSTRPTPARSARVEAAIDLDQTLFVVSSKSGGTIETLSHFEHFWERDRRRRRALRRDHRPRHAARAARRASTASARVFAQRPRHRRPLQRAVVLRARAGGADGRRRRGAARRRRARPSRPAAPRLGARTPGCGSAARSASSRCTAATS